MKVFACVVAMTMVASASAKAGNFAGAAPWEVEIANLRQENDALRADMKELRGLVMSNSPVAIRNTMRRKLVVLADMPTVDGIAMIADLVSDLDAAASDVEDRLSVEEDNTAAQACITFTSCSDE